MKLNKKGFSQRAISRILQIHRSLVKTFISADAYPERSSTALGSKLDRFKPYIHQRWAEGCNNAAQLWKEIVEQGYCWTNRMVYRYTQRFKKKIAEFTDKKHSTFLSSVEFFRIPTSRQATWLLISKAEDLSEGEKAFIEQLIKICSAIAHSQKMVEEFQPIVKRREVDNLISWIDKAKESSIAAFKGFAVGLQRDLAAVIAALVYQ